ncbi:MAG: hypothetical protein MZV64_54820 [Ignavibacteriales bacterium]|nr:hypothetical protein [Ignavibacteriales bacterium]
MEETVLILDLAMKLTGYEIEILREEKPFEEYEEDIELIDIKGRTWC